MHFTADSVSSIKEGKANRNKKQGKTRKEAVKALKMNKAELLDTGEIRLPDGKM